MSTSDPIDAQESTEEAESDILAVDPSDGLVADPSDGLVAEPSEALGSLSADPREILESLAACQSPFLIGVRHHSPTCAAAIPDLLDRFAPDRLLLELPAELQSWIEWLAHPDLEAPVALAGCRSDGSGLVFYPFADFSPELAAVRWARMRNVPVEAFDLPVLENGLCDEESIDQDRPPPGFPPGVAPGFPSGRDVRTRLLDALLQQTQSPDSESLWDRLVESRGVGASAEEVRRASLLVGWFLRLDAEQSGGVPLRDLRRETYMRSRLCVSAKKGERVAVVVGSFHAAALLPDPVLFRNVPRENTIDGTLSVSRGLSQDTPLVTSLVAYSNELLDSRSGYPAGIRDPAWQERVHQVLLEGSTLEPCIARCITEVCDRLRQRGHVASLPDAREAVRMSIDLSRLRNLPSPGRRELLESIESSLAQGEILGRGRVLAQALEEVMVGTKRGRLADGTPRSGLGPHVEALLAKLSLPGPDATSNAAKTMRLDPLRSPLDRRRQVALARLRTCGIPYGSEHVGTAAGGAETLTRKWDIRWEPATEAMLQLAGMRGVTLEQAAMGAVRADETRMHDSESLGCDARLQLLQAAMDCGLVELVGQWLVELVGSFLSEANLPQILRAFELVEGVRRGHYPALVVDSEQVVPGEISLFSLPDGLNAAPFLAAALRSLEGLGGSQLHEDAHALATLVSLFDQYSEYIGDGRLGWALAQLARDGAPLMQGAASALQVTTGERTSAEFGLILSSWLDIASEPEGSMALAGRLSGALCVAAPLFEANPGFLSSLIDRIEVLPDSEFLQRVPALRQGFDVLSAASRGRVLQIIGERLGDDSSTGQSMEIVLNDDPMALANFAEADAQGRAAVEER